MMKTTLLLLLAVCIASCQTQGNLLRCIGQSTNTAKFGVDLALQIKTKNTAGILKAIRDMVGQIDPLMKECSNPICLDEAKKRCESDTKQKCEVWGAIMYPKCKDGFVPSGCCLCVSQCPEGYRDDGLFCAKPSSYGRGGGYPWKFGDGFNLDGAWRRCQNDNPKNGCEQNGALIYPKCNSNFHSVGCCVCSPDCPSGYNDIGVSCQKKVYGRGAGYPMYYQDCQNSSTPTVTFAPSGLSIDELSSKIVDLTNQLTANQKNDQVSVQIATKLSEYLAEYELKLTTQKN